MTGSETSVTHRIHIDGGTTKWRNGGELAEQLMRCDVVIVEMSADEDGSDSLTYGWRRHSHSNYEAVQYII